MRIESIAAITVALAVAWHSAGQIVPSAPSLQVSDADGSWSIRINTGGGFTGRGRGAVTITSQGNLTCLQTVAPCDNKLADDRLRPLAQLVSSFDPSKWISPTPQENMTCNDCYTTSVTFARREGGNVKISTVSWSLVTQGKVPPDVVRIVEMALSGKW